MRKLYLLSLILLIFIIYSNSFHVPFQFDGKGNIEMNKLVHSLYRFFDLFSYSLSRVLLYISFALSYYFSELDVFGYHLWNTILHVFNSLLVYGLIILLHRTPHLKTADPRTVHLLALISSLLFAVHPVQTQAVTYIFQRGTSMASFFYLFSLFSFLYARCSMEEKKSAQSTLWGIFSVFFAILGMFTKEILFTLPWMILVTEIFFFQGKSTVPWRKRLHLIFPLLMCAGIIPAVFFLGKDYLKEAIETPNISRLEYFLTQPSVLCEYIRLYLLPFQQHLDYDVQVVSQVFSPRFLFPALFLLNILLLIPLLYRNNRFASFCILWCAMTISIESSVVILNDVLFEHRMYLPAFGYCSVFALFSLTLFKKKRVLVPWLIVLLLSFCTLTYARNHVWRSMESLWGDTVRKAPRNFRAQFALASIAMEKKDMHDIIHFHDKAIRIIEQYTGHEVSRKSNLHAHVKNLMALGTKKLEEGFPVVSEKLSRMALACRPRKHRFDIVENIALAVYQQERYEEAEELMLLSIEKEEHPRKYFNLATIYDQWGKIDQAVLMYHKTIDLDPENLMCYQRLIEIYFMQNKYEDVIQTVNLRVSQTDSFHPFDRYSRAKAYLLLGHIAEAIEDYKNISSYERIHYQLQNSIENDVQSYLREFPHSPHKGDLESLLQ